MLTVMWKLTVLVASIAGLLAGGAARADSRAPVTGSPKGPPKGRPPTQCTNAEWLSIKHEAARYCKAQKDAEQSGGDCQWILKDIANLDFCDGENHDLKVDCIYDRLVRKNPGRCEMSQQPGTNLYAVRITPDCWTWELTAVRSEKGWELKSATVSMISCD